MSGDSGWRPASVNMNSFFLFLEILMLQLCRQKPMFLSSGAFVLLALGLTADSASAQFVDFRTMAGASPAGYEDATGTAARFNAPTSVAVDAAGNVYVADQQNCFIRKVTPAGVVTTFAGTIVNDNPCGSTNGAGNVAQFNGPNGVATDSAAMYMSPTHSTIRFVKSHRPVWSARLLERGRSASPTVRARRRNSGRHVRSPSTPPATCMSPMPKIS